MIDMNFLLHRAGGCIASAYLIRANHHIANRADAVLHKGGPLCVACGILHYITKVGMPKSDIMP
jgi:hypothetical protein